MILEVNINEIKPNPQNPRVIKDDKFKKLVQSIKEFPEMLNIRPIVVNKDMIVLGGNMRLKACREAGLKEIPIIYAENLDEDKQREFIIKDNVGFGEWDWNNLKEWDQDELIEWGLDIPDFKEEHLEATDDGYEVPDEIQTDIVLGDLFEIGSHRLLCGDSTNVLDVEKLMNGEKAELLFTSPPYSDMRDYNGNKDLSIDNLINFIPTYLPFANYQAINLGIQKKDHEIVMYWNDYIKKAKECGYKFLSWNIWDQINATSVSKQNSMFAINHEWIFVFGISEKKLNRTWDKSEESKKRSKYFKINSNGQKVTTRRQKDGSVKETSLGEDFSNKNISTVISVFAEMERTINHPAKFPITLPSEYIKAMTDEKQIVSDPFCGSGSTMLASHQLKRKCYGMELDPKYCQVIIDRMRKLDPSIEIKRNGILLKTVGKQS